MNDTPEPGGPTGNPSVDAAAAPQAQILARLRAATLGTYDIYGELGRGGMATVFLAHEIALDRKVAIKVMAPALVLGAGMVERFKREAKTSAQLSHPNIIPIYSVSEAEGLLFFIMKLVEGTPLDAIMREAGQLPIPMVEAILAQVGGALGYAHRHGVVHRDIKPSNILIDDEGWAVVTDFGIAKVEESEALTQSGVAVGTPTYMSPEQCNGTLITGASDQYSLGVVAYEMLAGRPPFTGTSMMVLMYSHFNSPPPPLEQFRPDCPPQLRAAVLRMLEKDPAARWPSMEEAVAAMGARQLAHDDPTRSQLILLARTGSHKIHSRVQTPRSPVPLTRGTARKPAPDPTAPKQSRRTAWLAGGGVLAVLAVTAALLLRPPASAPVIPNPAPVAVPAPAPTAPSTNQPERAAVPPPAPPPPAPTGKLTGGTAAGATPPPSRSGAAVVPPTVQKVESLAPAPPPAPVPPPAPPPPAPTAPVQQAKPTTELPAAPAPRTVDDKADVTAAILGYARSLEAGDLAEARRMYPGMPPDQRQGLEAFWRAGGTMRPRWSVSDVVVDGNAATARIQGSNTVSTTRSRPTEQPVSLRARLERRGTEWRLLALVN